MINDIQGWMFEEELNYLNNIARHMGSIVEIGTWRGRSALALASSCNGILHCVDTWLGNAYDSGQIAEAAAHDIKQEFIDNMKQYDLIDKIRVYQMTSAEASKLFKNKSIDMLFVDGNHEYEFVKLDFDSWYPKIKKVIIGHDWTGDQVQKAVNEFISTYNYTVRTNLPGSLWRINLNYLIEDDE